MIRRPPRSTLFPYTDALPISQGFRQLPQQLEPPAREGGPADEAVEQEADPRLEEDQQQPALGGLRSEEHTSELQSRQYLVCRLLLEKKNNILLLRRAIYLHSV